MKMPTKEQIIASAQKCPQAKEVLEELFPEAFEPEIIQLGEFSIRVTEQDCYCAGLHHSTFEVRNSGKFHRKGLWLKDKNSNTNIEFEILEDDYGSLVLVAKKKI